MGTESIGFLGGDDRMAILARRMKSDGYEVRSWALPEAPGAAPLKEAAAAKRLVLPMPLARGGRLNGTDLKLEALWKELPRGSRAYAGAVPQAERERAETLGVRLTDYGADEALAVRNAALTAEGAVAAAMEHTRFALCGAPCLVLGYGRIGKALSRRLDAIGARVSVSARKREDLAWIESFGWEGLDTERLAGRLGGFRVIFNTVPHLILDAALLHELRRDCVLIELASVPGFDSETARAEGLNCATALGLPGRTAPETAAGALRETLYRIWKDEST